MKHMYIEQSLKNLNDDSNFSKTSDEYCEGEVSYARYLSFKVYSDKDRLFLDDNLPKVISSLYMKINSNDGRYFICKRKTGENKLSLYLVTFDDEEGFNKLGLWYAPVTIQPFNENNHFSQNEVDTLAIDYCLLFQCLTKYPLLRNCYTVITKSWKYRTNKDELTFPMLSHGLFDSLQSK